MIKKIALLFIIFIGLFLNSNTFGSNSYDNNIKQAELIEGYILSFKSNIIDVSIRYDVYNSDFLKEKYSELDGLVFVMKKIRSGDTQNNDPEKIIKNALKKFRTIHDELKMYLEEKKQFKEQKDFYMGIGRKVSQKISLILDNMYPILQKKSKLTSKEKKILEHLDKLKELNSFLSYMEKKEFNSTEEIKNNLVKIIINIKSEITSIKELMR